MIQNNNLFPLPWYDSIEKQNHRKDYAFGSVFPLITPDRLLLPFQILRSTRSNNITQVLIKKVNGTLLADITAPMKETGLAIKRFSDDGYDIIIYPGIIPMAINTPEGQYYAELSDGVERWYSEVFTIVRNVEKKLKIVWWNDEPLYYTGGHIEYDGSYKNILYLCSELAKPEYNFEEEGETRDGKFFPEKQISEKKYKFNFIAPEYMCDAMRLIRMSDHVTIYNNNEQYNADSFLITPTWQDQGDIAGVDAEFTTQTIVKKIGGAITPTIKGDFNNDFNNDFNR